MSNSFHVRISKSRAFAAETLGWASKPARDLTAVERDVLRRSLSGNRSLKMRNPDRDRRVMVDRLGGKVSRLKDRQDQGLPTSPVRPRTEAARVEAVERGYGNGAGGVGPYGRGLKGSRLNNRRDLP